MRLDQYLTKHFTIQSRNKASELIKLRKVTVNGKVVTKPSYATSETDTILVDQQDFYVSRSANKLKYFLEELDLQLENFTTLDIGSSTGGFTQVLLENKVQSVTCVDVGSNQLHESIKDDPRIIMKENTDIRNFQSEMEYDLITCDVSFISILYIIDAIASLASQHIIILYKPQFEVGKEVKRDSNGVVLDDKAIKEARENFITYTEKLQWKLQYRASSKVAGKNGNVEELFYFTL
jgi:23S rRNA (cytidine1920-2'-O)/16S rRNA (cytidine1409-2'-O)-methyltransferase